LVTAISSPYLKVKLHCNNTQKAFKHVNIALNNTQYNHRKNGQISDIKDLEYITAQATFKSDTEEDLHRNTGKGQK
jgi:hypothetical protein